MYVPKKFKTNSNSEPKSITLVISFIILSSSLVRIFLKKNRNRTGGNDSPLFSLEGVRG
jgi:hypothetical protein